VSCQSSGVILRLEEVSQSDSIGLRLPNQVLLFTKFFYPVNEYEKIVFILPNVLPLLGRPSLTIHRVLDPWVAGSDPYSFGQCLQRL
jgi:hypothetical protein